MGFALTGGEALWAQGFTVTRWLDTSSGHPGVLRNDVFHPSEERPLNRYGSSLKSIEYLPEQNAGTHSTFRPGMPPNFLAVDLLPRVFAKMGIPVAPNAARDTADLDLICNPVGEAATQWVLKKALEFGLVEPAAPPVDPPVVVPPPVQPPVVPPGQPGGLHPLSPSRQRADELRVIFVQMIAMKMLPIPDRFYNLAQVMVADRILFWPALRPVVAELVDSYRRARRSLGLDDREIPAEDR